MLRTYLDPLKEHSKTSRGLGMAKGVAYCKLKAQGARFKSRRGREERCLHIIRSLEENVYLLVGLDAESSNSNIFEGQASI